MPPTDAQHRHFEAQLKEENMVFDYRETIGMLTTKALEATQELTGEQDIKIYNALSAAIEKRFEAGIIAIKNVHETDVVPGEKGSVHPDTVIMKGYSPLTRGNVFKGGSQTSDLMNPNEISHRHGKI